MDYVLGFRPREKKPAPFFREKDCFFYFILTEQIHYSFPGLNGVSWNIPYG